MHTEYSTRPRENHVVTQWLDAISRFRKPEQRFIRNFSHLVGQTALADVAAPLPGRTISKPEGFELVPLVPDHRIFDSMIMTGPLFIQPKGIKVPEGVWIDASLGIGLAYDKKLAAISSAGIVENAAGSETLKIVELQGVAGAKKGDPNYYKTGLHQGLDWKATLVNAWAHIGQAVGATNLQIQSHENNEWGPVRQQRCWSSYDGVAQRMNFTQDPSGDWNRDLVSFPRAQQEQSQILQLMTHLATDIVF